MIPQTVPRIGKWRNETGRKYGYRGWERGGMNERWGLHGYHEQWLKRLSMPSSSCLLGPSISTPSPRSETTPGARHTFLIQNHQFKECINHFSHEVMTVDLFAFLSSGACMLIISVHGCGRVGSSWAAAGKRCLGWGRIWLRTTKSV